MAGLIITHTKIWTGNPARPYAEAVATDGDMIVAAGSNREVVQYRSTGAEVIKSPGALVIPGFIDSHIHLLQGGFALSGVQLKDALTKEDFIRRIRDFAGQMKPGEWMLEGYWDHENWGGELPARQWIDEFTRDIPLFLHRSDGHMALANTAALRLSGLIHQVPDVEGGAIERDAEGLPTGIFKDAAMDLIAEHIKPYSTEQQLTALENASSYLAANGVTSVHHMGSIADIELFRTAMETGRLKTRIYATVPIRENEAMLKTAGDFKALKCSTWLKPGGVKLFADGSLGAHTAAFFKSYLDTPDESGLLMYTDREMFERILTADRSGLQVIIHAIGDRANHQVLNLYERVMKTNPPRDRRFRIEHAQHLLSADIPRFGELGIIASMQPWHMMDDGRWAEKVIGRERIANTHAWRSLIDSGASLVFGSDWFVAPPKPLEGIFAAVTRQTLDGKCPESWVPNEKITVEEALKAYTIHAARASFDEQIKGSIEPGKLADFVVLDRDILNIPEEEILNTQVVKTVIGGVPYLSF
ncbi:MAG: amidohydrolase [Bacteroidales bacterium]|nr:amidohydrolase [Bacteroidales bacterium]